MDAKFIEDGVLVSIDVHNDLILELKKDSDIQRTNQSKTVSTVLSDYRKIASIIVNISMHLLLLRRYRYNVTESRRKLFPHRAQNAPIAPSTGSATALATTNRFSRPTGTNPVDLALNASARSIPLFSFLSSQCKLLALVKRVRHAVSDCIAPLCGEGGLDISVHYNMISSAEKLSDLTASKLESSPQNLAINLTITVIKG